METIGNDLRAAREQLGLSLDEAERATRIRARYLQAIEEGRLEDLPSPVQARGFVRNYAEFLGLESDDILLRYADVVDRRSASGRAAGTVESPPINPTIQIRATRPRWLTLDLFVAAAIVLTVVAVLIWGATRLLETMRSDTQAALEPAPLLLESSETAGPSPSPSSVSPVTLTPDLTQPSEPAVANGLEPTPFPTLEPFSGPITGVNLRILVERSAYMRVTVDGEEQFAGRVKPGEILEYRGREQIELLTGNAGGLRVLFNGQDEGILGELGEVLNRIWTTEGRITATPTVTPTPTATLRPTGTSAPTTAAP